MRTKKEIQEIKEDLETIQDMVVLGQTKGGKQLVKSLVKDVVSIIDTLCSQHRTLTEKEMIGLCAEMKSKIDVARVIDRAEGNANYLKELLEEALTTE